MGEETARIDLHDFEPETERFRRDVLEGLAQAQKSLPCKYFYDRRGSQLFERICELEAYYPTRIELSIMESKAKEMADQIEPRCMLIEYGSGSSRKTRVLLDHLDDPVAYVPIDISRSHLVEAAEELAAAYPEVEVLPVCADFTLEFELPETTREPARRVGYFPGSTIGNFDRDEASGFLSVISRTVGPGGGLLIGADLEKDPAILERAYDDPEGVTAEFNLNLLERINRELEADFDLERFDHSARWNPEAGRMEMNLVSNSAQSVSIGGERFEFETGETIHTENSHKYTLEGFEEIADSAGFSVDAVWTDDAGYFSVQYLTVA